jgi:hypothetical protein
MRSGLLVIAFGVFGCVPIPIVSDVYVPNPVDATVPKANASCVVNGTDTGASHKYKDVGISTNLTAADRDDPKNQLIASLLFGQITPIRRVPCPTCAFGLDTLEHVLRKTPLVDISVNPARIRLEENGQTQTARMTKFDTNFSANTNNRFDLATLQLPAPSGVSDALRLVFLPGAIRISGRDVPFAPIRFKRATETLVYIAPCIPA